MPSLKKKNCRNNMSRKILNIINTKIDLVQETLNKLVNKDEEEVVPPVDMSMTNAPYSGEMESTETIVSSDADASASPSDGIGASADASADGIGAPSDGIGASAEAPSDSDADASASLTEVPSSLINRSFFSCFCFS